MEYQQPRLFGVERRAAAQYRWALCREVPCGGVLAAGVAEAVNRTYTLKAGPAEGRQKSRSHDPRQLVR
jgi:hypothetical protein